MQLITNFVYNDPLLVKHTCIQPLKTVNNIKYYVCQEPVWKCHVNQSHRWQGKAKLSSRLINLICFRSWSVTNLMNFFSPEKYKARQLFMKSNDLCKTM